MVEIYAAELLLTAGAQKVVAGPDASSAAVALRRCERRARPLLRRHARARRRAGFPRTRPGRSAGGSLLGHAAQIMSRALPSVDAQDDIWLRC